MADSDSTFKFEELDPDFQRILKGEITDEERALWKREEELSPLYDDEEAMWFEGESRGRYLRDVDSAMHLREIRATTYEEKQACEAVNAVLKDIIKKPESKKICAEHGVGHEFLTEVLNNLGKCVTQVTLLRLAKEKRYRLEKEIEKEIEEEKRDQQLKLEMQMREQPKRKGKLTSADDEIPSSKKMKIDGEGNSGLKKSEQIPRQPRSELRQIQKVGFWSYFGRPACWRPFFC